MQDFHAGLREEFVVGSSSELVQASARRMFGFDAEAKENFDATMAPLLPCTVRNSGLCNDGPLTAAGKLLASSVWSATRRHFKEKKPYPLLVRFQVVYRKPPRAAVVVGVFALSATYPARGSR